MAAHSTASLGVEQLKSDSRNYCTDNNNQVAPITRASLNIQPMTVLSFLFSGRGVLAFSLRFFFKYIYTYIHIVLLSLNLTIFSFVHIFLIYLNIFP